MACGKKLLHSLVMRAQMLWYIFPDSMRLKNVFKGVCVVSNYAVGLVETVCGVDAHYGKKRDPEDLLRCLHYLLQGLAI